MKTLLFASGKGGAGKSTLARTVAVTAAQDGGRVLLVDLDPQQSLNKWWQHRATDDIDLIEVAQAGQLKVAATKAAQKYDWLVIDSPPSAPVWLADVMKLADLTVVPTRPSPDDLAALGVTLKALKDAGAPFIFALTQVPVRGRFVDESARVLAKHGRVCPVNIGLRVSFQETSTTGEGVSETTDTKAKAEALGLWNYVKEVL